ncbi:MAG: NlpC/P60 family protein [Bacillaceae bacterium]|nr:NlpC/P60 family protein [Bacillaceae bacterium]
MKKPIIYLSVLLMVFGVTNSVYAFEHIPQAGIAINREMVNGIDPIKIDGEYYVPFTRLSKILGYRDIRFEDATKTYEVTDGSTTLRITMGGTRAKKGDEYINVVPPRYIYNVGYISLDAASALFNAFIYFKPEDGSIQVETPATRYRVQRGDSLWFIAQSYHTTVEQLKSLNRLTSDTIFVGQILLLPSKESVRELEPILEKKPVKKPATTSNPDLISSILGEGQQYIGAPYKFGATLAEAPNTFDCSSFTQFLFRNQGVDIPRSSRQQASVGEYVTNMQPGDLIFFTSPSLYSDGRVGHVGIYMGNGDMLHASSSRGVHISKNFMGISYWRDNYLFTKRVLH